MKPRTLSASSTGFPFTAFPTFLTFVGDIRTYFATALTSICQPFSSDRCMQWGMPGVLTLDY
jgi:hypothetical protein